MAQIESTRRIRVEPVTRVRQLPFQLGVVNVAVAPRPVPLAHARYPTRLAPAQTQGDGIELGRRSMNKPIFNRRFSRCDSVQARSCSSFHCSLYPKCSTTTLTMK